MNRKSAFLVEFFNKFDFLKNKPEQKKNVSEKQKNKQEEAMAKD